MTGNIAAHVAPTKRNENLASTSWYATVQFGNKTPDHLIVFLLREMCQSYSGAFEEKV